MKANRKIYMLKPPGKGWPSPVYGNHLIDTRLENFIELSDPDPNIDTHILWFHNKGDYLSLPSSSLYDGTVLDMIPQAWHSYINKKRIHIIINTSEESWGPVYENKINHMEAGNVHIALAESAKRLNLDPKQITWLTGDLNAEEYCSGSDINVKSICWFNHSFVRVLHNGSDNFYDKFKNHNDDPEKFMIFLNRWPKAHRSYIASRIWEMQRDTDNNYFNTNNMVMSFPKDLHGQNICNSYCDIKYKKDVYSEHFDKHNLINWSKLRDNILDLYYYLPFLADEIDVNENNCAGIDAVDSVQELYQSSAFSLITETWAEGGKTFISDAIFMSICYGVPFLVVGNCGTLKKLREFGFQTYSNIFDETYDLIEDDVQRWEAVLSEVAKLSKLPRHEYIELYHEAKHITEFNYNMMYQLADQAEQELNNWLLKL